MTKFCVQDLLLESVIREKNISDADLFWHYQNDDDGWNRFIFEILQCDLDNEQEQIVHSIQHNKRTTAKSGHARGKDYTGAAVCLTHCLLYNPSKTIVTAPTQRQVYSINMSEIETIYNHAETILNQSGNTLGANIMRSKITFDDEPNHFLEAFKAADKSTESWTGYHSQNILLLITEASGIENQTYEAVEGLLTGTSRLVLLGNPNLQTGEYFRSFRDPQYSALTLDCLFAPNVRNKFTGKDSNNPKYIKGQVDWEYVNDRVHKPGWTQVINEKEFGKDPDDFVWESPKEIEVIEKGKTKTVTKLVKEYRRPNDLFLIKIRGKFGRESNEKLVPLSWLELAQERWKERSSLYDWADNDLFLGADIAGMGIDLEVHMPRFGNYVEKPRVFAESDAVKSTGRLITYAKLQERSYFAIFVDSIGEGAGTYANLKQYRNDEILDGCAVNYDIVCCKGSNRDRISGLTDLTGVHKFFNARSYCYWALRENLDPKLGGLLALPPCEELIEDIHAHSIVPRSDGLIQILQKEKVKESLKRSPDYSDPLAYSYFPYKRDLSHLINDTKPFKGVGVF